MSGFNIGDPVVADIHGEYVYGQVTSKSVKNGSPIVFIDEYRWAYTDTVELLEADDPRGNPDLARRLAE